MIKEIDSTFYRIERSNSISQEIKSRINIHRDMRILDFGCGAGYLGLALSDTCEKISFFDNSEVAINHLTDNLNRSNVINAKIFRTVDELMNQDCFDLIVSSMVLHHIENYLDTIDLLCSFLKDDGFLCLSDYDEDDGFFHMKDELYYHAGIERMKIIDHLKKRELQEIQSSTVYINKKLRDDVIHQYPIYLVSGKMSSRKFKIV